MHLGIPDLGRRLNTLEGKVDTITASLDRIVELLTDIRDQNSTAAPLARRAIGGPRYR